MPANSTVVNVDQTQAAKKRVALYLRVSTMEQATEGYSIPAQEQNGRDFAKRHGYEVVAVYADEGESGKSTKHRKEYQRMMGDAALGLFDLVVIWKLTRLGRNMLDILQTVEALTKNDVGLFSISEQFDVTTSSGKLMLQLLGSFGEFERNQIAENVSMTMLSLVRDQQRYAGGRRLGYTSGTDENGRKQLIVQPDEAKIVKLIYARFLEGDGYKQIADFLNRQGYRTVKGNRFSPVAIKDILSNKIYGGFIEYARYTQWDAKRRKGKNPNPICVKGDHEPIIDETTYKLVQNRLTSKKAKPKHIHAGENVLTGLLRCPECGAPMAASNVTNTLKDGTKKRIRYYSCSEYRNKGAKACHANSIRTDFAEAFVAERLKEIIQVPQVLESLVHQINEEVQNQIMPLEQELAVIAVEKDELAVKLSRLNAALEASPDLRDNLSGRIQELESKILLHDQREEEILGILSLRNKKIQVQDVTKLTGALDELLQHSSKRQMKEIYQTFISKITFDPLNKEAIKIYMNFDEGIVTQLNEIYQGVLSEKTDKAPFGLPGPYCLTV